MVAAKSPHTYGDFEMGDTYAKEILLYGRLTSATPEWLVEQGKRSNISGVVERIG